MKLAFSSNAYLRFSIEETIARVAALGYTGIELLADVPHAWPAGLLEEQKQSIRDALAKHKLTISNINAFMMNAMADPRQPYWHPSWIEPDPHYRAIRREHTKRALQLAHELGAPHITTEPGGPLAAGQTWQAGADVFYDELMPCVEVAEKLGVPMLIEPEPELLIERFDQYLEFVGRIDSPMVGLNFDIGHAYCVGEDPQDWVAKMAQPHAALSLRRHRRHARAPASGPGPRGDRFRRHAGRNPQNRLHRLAHRRTLSVHRRSRRCRPRSHAISASATSK